MSDFCRRCRWRFPNDNDHLFCGLCGAPSASLVFSDQNKEFTPSHGLFFYPHNKKNNTINSIEIKNIGFKKLKLKIVVSADYEFCVNNSNKWVNSIDYTEDFYISPSGSNSDADSSYTISIRHSNNPFHAFPRKNTSLLEIHTPLNQYPTTIPLLISEEPKWSFVYKDQVIAVDLLSKNNFDLYPDGDEVGWDCHLLLEHGNAFVSSIRLEQDRDEHSTLELNQPNQSYLCRTGERLDFKISWHQNSRNKPKRAFVHFDIRNLKTPIIVPICVHPFPKINLSLNPKDAHNDLVIPNEGAAFKHILIENKGDSHAQLTSVHVHTPGVSLAQIVLRRQGGGDAVYQCENLQRLPTAVSDALVRSAVRHEAERELVAPSSMNQHEPSVSARVLAKALGGGVGEIDDAAQGLEGFEEVSVVDDSYFVTDHQADVYAIVLKIAPQVELSKNAPQGILEGRLTLTLYPLNQRGERDQNPMIIEKTFNFRARRIERVEEESGYLLIDYGTIHTCAMAFYKESFTSNVICFEDNLDQFKSVFRLVRSRAQNNEFEFGEEIWESIAAYLPSVEFAAKLRLGTRELRCLRDQDNAVRLFSGRESTQIFLAEVMRLARERTGRDFERIYFTAPAAFHSREHDDMRDALAAIGYKDRVEFACTEPEAYLYNLESNKKFMDMLTHRVKSSAQNTPLLGYVFDFGGGTTDITIFEMLGLNIRVISTYGYRRLGGEALTQMMAAYIYHQLSPDNQERFPFPEFQVGNLFVIQEHGVSKAHLHNFAELRRQAEDLKCSANWSKLVNLNIRDHSNVLHSVDVQISQDLLDFHVKSEMFDEAINDLIKRISLMREAQFILSDIPKLIVVAGNSGRLRGLQDILTEPSIAMDSDDPPLYFYDQENAKLGVVKGLAQKVMENGRLAIDASDTSRDWLYISLAGRLELVLPAGAPLGRSPGSSVEEFISEQNFRQRVDEGKYFVSSPFRLTGAAPREVLIYSSDGADRFFEVATSAFPVNLAYRFVIPQGAVERSFYHATLCFYDEKPLLLLRACDLNGVTLGGDWTYFFEEELK